MQPPVDRIELWVLAPATLLLLMLGSELGFRCARRFGRDSEKSQSSTLAAALLALLGLLLAFCFGIVDSRFSARKSLVIQEANAIGTTYLRAATLPEPHAATARTLLREYTDVRLSVQSVEAVLRLQPRTEQLQDRLWHEAVASAAQDPHSLPVSIFIQSLNTVFDLQQERITVAVYHRLPFPMLCTLFAVALLSLGAHGYSAGLDGRRAPLPTLALILAVCAVLVVIIEFDRPWQRVFEISQQALISTRARM